MISTRRSVLAGFALLPLSVRLGAAEAVPEARPPNWAEPIRLDGAPNLHRVEDKFFRGAQPTAAGLKVLASEHGLRTVISLRAFNSDEPLAKGLDLKLVRFPIYTWHIERRYVVGALRALRAAAKDGPVLVHCQHGADRTGLISALYRILYHGWRRDEALDEMRNGEFGFHAVWGNIPRFVRGVDIERLRRDVGGA